MTAGSPQDSLIRRRLAEELGDLRRFFSLLEAERDILTRGEADKLPPLVEQKSTLATRLSALLAEREQALANAGFPAGREGTEAWLSKLPPADPAREQWAQLLALAEEARRQQETNGKLIAIQLQNTQQALAALMSASGRPLTYGPDGQQRVGGGGRRLGSA